MKLTDFVKNKAWKGSFQAIGMKFAAARPELMLIGGIISVLGGTIYACTKTEEGKKAVEDYKTANENVKNLVVAGDEKQQKIEKGKKYVQNTGIMLYQMVKIYGIPALLWFGGMGMITGAHGELRKINKNLVAEAVSVQNLLKEYRGRVADAVGEDTEQRIFMGVQEGMVNVLEKDPETGEEKVVSKQADVFYAQPGSIFATNFTEETVDDCFDMRYFKDEWLDNKVWQINRDLELGVARCYTGLEILRMFRINENALGEDEKMEMLCRYGISGNARKVPDPEMRKLKITRMRGYQKKWDVARGIEIWVPCLRLDFNFYPLEGKI